MIIECPHCYHDNEIEYAEHIRCKKCEKDYKGFSFSKRKWIATGTIVVSALFGVHTGKEYLFHNNAERYPMELEYAYLDSCINANDSLHTMSRYRDKRKECLCALAETQKQISYAEASKNIDNFKKILMINASNCR
ncbi:hypothetical protein [Shewanella baltica]|uniref:hypothetical protein n=1 Tax=Shewanella baltica TaxID=62322 RepID=UPI00217ED228|nr:hypothetical protein [Shewanella baltica]MCS6174540.1 hypothetical protein [Shewanella baltica]MCS6190695.1 hypothetical protein [Shewanella baltica]MCS6240942.1 hypothetical protein [Shewanella baltica]